MGFKNSKNYFIMNRKNTRNEICLKLQQIISIICDLKKSPIIQIHVFNKTGLNKTKYRTKLDFKNILGSYLNKYNQNTFWHQFQYF